MRQAKRDTAHIPANLQLDESILVAASIEGNFAPALEVTPSDALFASLCVELRRQPEIGSKPRRQPT
ncbi:hypothetical protein LFL96_22650 [Paraburkholderia sp. D15]|uniref:hypothetical protein n=1 Tax=Paraburkholderia sp. D15 TaxID=2880218 RepID=UPI00247A6068|nr:hypothetical protein [Paraburkholderia sp. D15]WGS53844.1 hypothetical protein LFL96_22650 [Paraburkholderia sp. D15]